MWQSCCCHCSHNGDGLWVSPVPKDFWTTAPVGLRMPRAAAWALSYVLWYVPLWRQWGYSQLLPVVTSLSLERQSDCAHSSFLFARSNTFFSPSVLCSVFFSDTLEWKHSFCYFYWTVFFLTSVSSLPRLLSNTDSCCFFPSTIPS